MQHDRTACSGTFNPQAAGPTTTADAIHRVPLERWDLDQAEALQGDALTLAAQVGRKGCTQAIWHLQAGNLFQMLGSWFSEA